VPHNDLEIDSEVTTQAQDLVTRNFEQMGSNFSLARCLTYCPWAHLGYGPGQTCVSLVENFPDHLLKKVLILPSARRPISESVKVEQAVPFLLRPLPYVFKFGATSLNHYFSEFGIHCLNQKFLRAIQKSDPDSTIAYFWPDPPRSLVQAARDRGLLTVREMINTFRGTARIILEEAYDRLGLKPDHNITDESVERERNELALYDYVFASNPMVEASLLDAGIERARIIPTSFGWSPARFAASPGEHTRNSGFRALFVGSICVRKGVPQLLAAWVKSGVKGELVLVGDVESAINPLLTSYCGANQSIRVLDFVSDVGSLYRSADIFVFPTLEEGGPQVTYEAAGCGLPIVTSPMGAARLVKDGINGLVVNPVDIDGLAEAIARLAASSELRERFGQQARKDAKQYTYEHIGFDRALKLSWLRRAP
jgi:glycosyltransferase involved in cell wall biosynthesis